MTGDLVWLLSIHHLMLRFRRFALRKSIMDTCRVTNNCDDLHIKHPPIFATPQPYDNLWALMLDIELAIIQREWLSITSHAIFCWQQYSFWGCVDIFDMQRRNTTMMRVVFTLVRRSQISTLTHHACPTLW